MQNKARATFVKNKNVPPKPFSVTNRLKRLPKNTNCTKLNKERLYPNLERNENKNGITSKKLIIIYALPLKISPKENNKREIIGRIFTVIPFNENNFIVSISNTKILHVRKFMSLSFYFFFRPLPPFQFL